MPTSPRLPPLPRLLQSLHPRSRNGLSPSRDQIAGQLGRQSLFLTILGFLGIGLLLAFTPCVLPMVPIVSGMITGSGDNVSARRAFVLTLVYVLAMAATYALAGVAIGLSGVNLQAWFSDTRGHRRVRRRFRAVGVIHVRPLRVARAGRIAESSESCRADTPAAVRRVPQYSVVPRPLIVGPCVTPPLVGTLLFIAQTGSALVGGVALLSLGIGMGIPLLAVGTSLGKWLPRPGPLLERINVFFGVLLLAVAVWLLDRVVTLVTTQLARWHAAGTGGRLLCVGAAATAGRMVRLARARHSDDDLWASCCWSAPRLVVPDSLRR